MHAVNLGGSGFLVVRNGNIASRSVFSLRTSRDFEGQPGLLHATHMHTGASLADPQSPWKCATKTCLRQHAPIYIQYAGSAAGLHSTCLQHHSQGSCGKLSGNDGGNKARSRGDKGE